MLKILKQIRFPDTRLADEVRDAIDEMQLQEKIKEDNNNETPDREL